MIRPIFATLLAALLAVGAAADEKTFCHLLPPDTLGVVTLPSVGKSCEAFKQTALYKLCHETELAHLCDAVHTALEQPLAQLDESLMEQFGLGHRDLLATFRGELGLAVIALSPEGGPPRMLICAEYGDQEAAIRAVMDRFARSVAEDRDWNVEPPAVIPPNIETLEHAGAQVFVIKRKGRERVEAAYTLVGGRLLLAPALAEITDALDRRAGTVQDSLYDNPAFKAACEAAQVHGAGATNLAGYIHLAQVWPMLGEDAQRPLAESGLSDWQAIAVVSRFEQGAHADTLYIHTSGPRRGLTRLLLPGLIEDRSALARIPKSALGWSIGRMDARGSWDEVLRTVKAIDEGTYGQLTEQIARFEEQCGGAKIEDYLASFGGQFVTHTRMPAAGLLPQSVFQLQLADPAAFLTGIKALSKGLGFDLVSLSYGGREVHHLQMPLGQLGSNPLESAEDDPFAALRLVLGLLPSHFYVDGSWAVFGHLHQDLCDHIDLGAFEALGEVAIPAGAVCYGQGNAAPMIVGLYNTALPMAGSLEGLVRSAGVPFDSRYLPRASTLLKYLSEPATFSVVATEQGIAIRGTGTAIAAPFAIGAAGAMFFVGVRAGGGSAAPPDAMPPALPEVDPPAERDEAPR